LSLASPEIVLSTRALTKRFGALVVVDDISLDIR
jgi:ABC-type branched-subunit amino acid transport system ATPase component